MSRPKYSSFLDLFFKSNDIELMKSIIFSTDEHIGLFQKSVVDYYGECMHNTVIRLMSYCFTQESSVPNPYIAAELRITFIFLLVEVNPIQVLVTKQLLKNKDMAGYEFFKVYIKFAKLVIYIYSHHPFHPKYPLETQAVHVYIASILQYAWNTRATHLLKLNLKSEIQLLNHQSTIVTKKKDAHSNSKNLEIPL